ncbi:hypothetical protein FACS189427_12610 [Planctomycetales bacterium]|nr:hypothetical protein FACS189427_12610 [Planctomycetales bacterium]
MKSSRKNKLQDILPENFVNVIRYIGLCIGIAVSFFLLVLFIAVLFRQNGGLFLPDCVLDVFAFILLLLTGSGLMFHLRRRYGHLNVLYFVLLGFIAPFPYFIIYTYIILLLDFAFFPIKSRQMPEVSDESPVSAAPSARVNDNISEDNDLKEDGKEIWDENITHQLTRRKTQDGNELVEGMILAEFTDNQLTATVHIPFCPPFEQTPAVEAYLLEDTDATVSVSSSEVFGVRFEVKRKKNSAAKTVRFAFTAEV